MPSRTVWSEIVEFVGDAAKHPDYERYVAGACGFEPAAADPALPCRECGSHNSKHVFPDGMPGDICELCVVEMSNELTRMRLAKRVERMPVAELPARQPLTPIMHEGAD